MDTVQDPPTHWAELHKALSLSLSLSYDSDPLWRSYDLSVRLVM